MAQYINYLLILTHSPRLSWEAAAYNIIELGADLIVVNLA
jgi:aspartate aminotransferase-like enzyme